MVRFLFMPKVPTGQIHNSFISPRTQNNYKLEREREIKRQRLNGVGSNFMFFCTPDTFALFLHLKYAASCSNVWQRTEEFLRKLLRSI